MNRLFLLLVTAGLAACGVDGAPIRPSLDTTISVTPNGVTVTPQATVTSGPVTVGVKL